jgi:hypothetical protein
VLSCKRGIAVPLQKLGKKGITGFLQIPAGKCNLVYQSFDGPEPTPSMANMLLDDITISN